MCAAVSAVLAGATLSPVVARRARGAIHLGQRALPLAGVLDTSPPLHVYAHPAAADTRADDVLAAALPPPVDALLRVPVVFAPAAGGLSPRSVLAALYPCVADVSAAPVASADSEGEESVASGDAEVFVASGDSSEWSSGSDVDE
jgi:hypothetical protein